MRKPRRIDVIALGGWVLVTGFAAYSQETTARTGQEPPLRIPVREYLDRMAGGWLGQMAGVGWGGPTEFQWNGKIIPPEAFPAWKPEMINQFEQDDLYVEMTFLHTLEVYGLDVSIRQAGIDFANSRYPLWHANKFGRRNLHSGIAPPDSGHPAFNRHADDIDYQIEADFSGLISPGLPNMAVTLGETFGRLMNYGDGLYGGQFIGAMYSYAFREKDPRTIVEKALAWIPADSQYAECVRDVLQWHQEEPENWQAVWQRVNEKYHLNPSYRRFSCGQEDGFNIDAKINGAYVVMGLLYGKGDPDRTIEIATRCGQDSDCNPSSAAGVLFTTFGMSGAPAKFTSALRRDVKFSHTAYDFDTLLRVCEKLARQAVLRGGGQIVWSETGEEAFLIPCPVPVSRSAEQCWDPAPPTNGRYGEEEMAKITEKETD
ncbi:MAG TPA: ADP-ribosylglycohydrolase family protein [Candidatus Hydrogenedentes bacterium]|nr:ADP-ribosylglycohydrolase family protein [Candidatus Hydrogenedentota bacterium]